jgi:hypothetical protein
VARLSLCCSCRKWSDAEHRGDFYDQDVGAPAWSYSDIDTQASKLLSAEKIKALKSRAEAEVAARWSEAKEKVEKQRLAKELQKQLKKAATELKKQQIQQHKEARAQQKQPF